MKIALIDGSPKTQGSASYGLLEELRSFLDGEEFLETGLHKPSVDEEALGKLQQAEALVIAFPLYVDGVPGHLLSCLMELEKAAWKEDVRVYSIVNCGFYEGVQNKPAMEILKNWCVKARLAWGGGVGVGGGGALAQMPAADGHGPRGPVDKALEALAKKISEKGEMGETYVSLAFPRFLYKLAGQMGWRQQIKKNGGKGKDLGKRW